LNASWLILICSNPIAESVF